jgi:cytochrome c biogenesis protein CcmG/thiol:disulfide interchange protein DsbE
MFAREAFLTTLFIILLSVPALAEMTGGIPVGDTGQDIAVVPLGGSSTKLSALANKRPIMLVVFLPTCSHCQAAVPEMNKVFKKLDPAKATMIVVGLNQTAKAVEAFKVRYGATYPMAADPTNQVGRPYNIQGVPSYFIMDKNRVVKFEGHAAPADTLVNQLHSLATPPAHPSHP